MTAITDDYLWAFSTITKSALQASESYRISSFAVQSDQTSLILGWTEPQRKDTQRPKRQRYFQNLLQAQQSEGFWIAVLSFPVLTPGMMSFIDTNQFSSGTVESAPATIQCWDDNVQGFSAFQMTVNRPVPGQDFDTLMGLYIDVKYRFTRGTRL